MRHYLQWQLWALWLLLCVSVGPFGVHAVKAEEDASVKTTAPAEAPDEATAPAEAKAPAKAKSPADEFRDKLEEITKSSREALARKWELRSEHLKKGETAQADEELVAIEEILHALGVSRSEDVAFALLREAILAPTEERALQLIEQAERLAPGLPAIEEARLNVIAQYSTFAVHRMISAYFSGVSARWHDLKYRSIALHDLIHRLALLLLIVGALFLFSQILRYSLSLYHEWGIAMPLVSRVVFLLAVLCLWIGSWVMGFTPYCLVLPLLVVLWPYQLKSERVVSVLLVIACGLFPYFLRASVHLEEAESGIYQSIIALDQNAMNQFALNRVKAYVDEHSNDQNAVNQVALAQTVLGAACLRRWAFEKRKENNADQGTNLSGKKADQGTDLPGVNADKGMDLPGTKADNAADLPGAKADKGTDSLEKFYEQGMVLFKNAFNKLPDSEARSVAAAQLGNIYFVARKYNESKSWYKQASEWAQTEELKAKITANLKQFDLKQFEPFVQNPNIQSDVKLEFFSFNEEKLAARALEGLWSSSEETRRAFMRLAGPVPEETAPLAALLAAFLIVLVNVVQRRFYLAWPCSRCGGVTQTYWIYGRPHKPICADCECMLYQKDHTDRSAVDAREKQIRLYKRVRSWGGRLSGLIPGLAPLLRGSVLTGMAISLLFTWFLLVIFPPRLQFLVPYLPLQNEWGIFDWLPVVILVLIWGYGIYHSITSKEVD